MTLGQWSLGGKDISQQGTWPDYPAIKGAQTAYQISIQAFDLDGSPMWTKRVTGKVTMYVLYEKDVHFDLLIPCEECTAEVISRLGDTWDARQAIFSDKRFFLFR